MRVLFRGLPVSRVSARSVAALIGCALTGFAGSAAPCTPAAPPVQGGEVFDYSEVVPSDGVFVLRYRCLGCAEESLELTVQGPVGEPVSGAVVASGKATDPVPWVAWKPDVPLISGEHYQVEIGAPFEPDNVPELSFVASAGTLAFPEYPVDVRVDPRVIMQGDQVCCEKQPGMCGDYQPCFVDVEATSFEMNLVADWYTAAAERIDALQFVYSGTLTAGEQISEVDWTPESSVSSPFSVAESYCYEIKVRRIVDGEEVGLAEGCVDHEDVALPDVAEATSYQMDVALSSCTVPPEGFEEQWCENYSVQWTQQYCDGVDPRPCDAARTVCIGTEAGVPPGVDPVNPVASVDPVSSVNPVNSGGSVNSGGQGDPDAVPEPSAEPGPDPVPDTVDATEVENGADSDPSASDTSDDAASDDAVSDGDKGGQPASDSGASADEGAAQDPELVGVAYGNGDSEDSQGCSLRATRRSGSGAFGALFSLGLVFAATRRRRATR